MNFYLWGVSSFKCERKLWSKYVVTLKLLNQWCADFIFWLFIFHYDIHACRLQRLKDNVSTQMKIFDESFLKKILANNNTNEYSNVWIPAVSTTYQELSLNKELNNIDHRNINDWMLGMILFINHVVIINHHVNQIMFDSLIKHVGVTLDWETN